MRLTDEDLILTALTAYRDSLKHGINYGDEVLEWADMYEMKIRLDVLINDYNNRSK